MRIYDYLITLLNLNVFTNSLNSSESFISKLIGKNELRSVLSNQIKFFKLLSKPIFEHKCVFFSK